MGSDNSTVIKDRALELLGSGISSEVVATALGVSPSYISQLLAEEGFSAQVMEKRFLSLQSHNKRDSNYDEVEDKLLAKLEEALPLIYKPAEILGAIRVVNNAKRRGQSAPDQIVNQKNIVNIMLPTKIVQQFTTNVHNQVIKAGEQELVTIQSSKLLERAKREDDTRTLIENQEGRDN